MATQEFKPETITATPPTEEPQSIKDQFQQGPTQEAPRVPTMEEVMEYRRKETERMESELPYMRMKEEYNRLEMALYEQGVMLGAIPLTNEQGKVIVPGLLGIELYMRQQEAISQFAAYRSSLQQQADKMRQEEEKQQQDSTNIAD